MNVTVADRFLAMAPFLAAFVLYALSPELNKVARWRIEGTVSGAKMATGSISVPPHLSAGYIGDYVEYGIDAAQIVPMLLLPLVGVLVSWHLGLAPGIAWTVFACSLVIAVTVTIIFLRRDPVAYVSKKLFARYTLLSATGVGINFVAAVLVGIFV